MNAAQYSSLARPQFNGGCQFIDTLGLKPGDKVLDMGCGTGEITRYIADEVGKNGEVVGVDPDVERIKLAQENLANTPNVLAEVGDSVSGFPHANEAYYDLHFSNQAFHWIDLKGKQIFIKKAFECLKPQGLLAIQCLAKPEGDVIGRFVKSSMAQKATFVAEAEVEELLSKSGFTNVEIYILVSYVKFNSFNNFAAWWSASVYTDPNDVQDKKLLEDFKKEIQQPDGRVKTSFRVMHIKARKQALKQTLNN